MEITITRCGMRGSAAGARPAPPRARLATRGAEVVSYHSRILGPPIPYPRSVELSELSPQSSSDDVADAVRPVTCIK